MKQTQNCDSIQNVQIFKKSTLKNSHLIGCSLQPRGEITIEKFLNISWNLIGRGWGAASGCDVGVIEQFLVWLDL